MLLTNRRIAFLHALLAAMQAAWITTFFLLAWPRPLPVAAGYAIVLAGLVAWMLALELLSRRTDSPLYDALALGGLLAVSLLLVWLVMRPGGPAQDPAWMGAMLTEPGVWRGLPLLLVLVGLNVVLWQRASAATSRELNFFSVGVTFRSGLILLVAGGALLAALRGVTALGLLWGYLGLGLTAVAISRVSEKASEAQSSGRLLPARRLIQVILAAVVAVGATWVLSLGYTGRGIGAFFRLFDPLWQLLKPLALALAVLLGKALNPLLMWFEAWLTRLLSGASFGMAERGAAGGAATQPNPLGNFPRWPLDLARSAILALIIVGAILGVIIFLLLFLERVRKSSSSTEDEDEGLERATLGGGILRRAADSLRGLGALVRRFGLGWELLAAISVENIYANLCRIARQRGHPRRISQPPDAYLPVLAQVFPGQDDRLGRITAAYMRVHYGEHPVPSKELAALREDYAVLRTGALRAGVLRAGVLRTGAPPAGAPPAGAPPDESAATQDGGGPAT